MSKFLVVTVGLFFVLALTSAGADQCAWVSKSVAKRAEKLIKEGDTVSFLCEPCGETTPVAAQVTSIEAARVSDQSEYWEVSINGEPVDLAYVFLKVSEKKQLNVAAQVGCPTIEVSSSIRAHAKK